MKKIKFKIILVFNISCFLCVSCYFQLKKNKNWCKKKNSGGGGGGGVEFFFMLFSTLQKIETPRPSVRPSITFSLLVKWEVVSPNTGSRQGQLESISIIYSDFVCISNVGVVLGGGGGGVVGGGGGGGCNGFLHILCYFQHF